MKIDWCSGWFDKWGDIDFSECCHKHDLDYTYIKTLPTVWQRAKARWKADNDLMICVRKKGLPPMGLLMFAGVRMFGWPVVYGASKFKKENKDENEIS